jgi:hypothetical protein
MFAKTLATLVIDDVPALEKSYLTELVPAIRAMQHEQPYTNEDSYELIVAFQEAIFTAPGERPSPVPPVTDEMKAYRERFVIGAHSLAAQGPDKCMTRLAVRLVLSMQGEMEKNRGSVDSQLQGVFTWSLLAVASGPDTVHAPLELCGGILQALAGWSEIFTGQASRRS